MWHTPLSCALALAFLSAPALAADDIKIEKVIGTEKPGAYKHPAAITELDNGDLFITFYGGGGEYEDESKVYGIRRSPGATEWTEPQLLADTPFRGEGNGIVWQAPDGVVWLFYVQRYGDTWSDARIKAKISTDGAHTWSDSMVLSFEMGTMVRGRPIVLNDGNYLLPVYHETGGDREEMGADTCSYFLRYDPKTHEWTPSERIYSKIGNLQPEPVQITDDYLITYNRVGGNYEPSDSRYIIRSESHDGGHTWSPGVDSQFPNPNAAVSFIKLQNGHLLLAYNDNMNERTPLTIAISEDKDKTWPHRRDIGSGDNSFAYPMAIQAKDGTIYVVYTTDSRATVMLASFKEEAILGHTK
jgi:predicted neuraminidase